MEFQLSEMVQQSMIDTELGHQHGKEGKGEGKVSRSGIERARRAYWQYREEQEQALRERKEKRRGISW